MRSSKGNQLASMDPRPKQLPDSFHEGLEPLFPNPRPDQETLNVLTGNLLTLSNNPNLVIRRRPVNDGRIEEARAHQTEAMAMYQSLKDTYGVAVARNHLLEGKTETGEPAIYVVVDTIEGRELKDLKPEEKKELAPVIDATVSGLLRQLKDAYVNGTPFPTETTLRQFRWGHPRRLPKDPNRLYLIDFDALFEKFRRGDSDQEAPARATIFLSATTVLLYDIITGEAATGGILPTARQTGLDLIATLQTDEALMKIGETAGFGNALQEMVPFLRGQRQ